MQIISKQNLEDFSSLEKKWNQTINDIYHKISTENKETFESNSYALEHLTFKKITKNFFNPKLIVINGPSGAGKSSVGKILEKINYKRIPRITDRPKRPAEVEGKDYIFTDTATFNDFVNKDKILAGKTSFGFGRGFLKETFLEVFSTSSTDKYYSEGNSSLQALKEAQRFININPSNIFNIFILPPSFKELYNRLLLQHKEGNFAHDELKDRLQEGVKYLKQSLNHLDYFPNSVFIVNDELERLVNIFSSNLKYLTFSLNDKLELKGVCTEEYAHKVGLIHAISVVFIFNSDKELLIQKRKDNNLWDHSSAGHVDLGESYEEGAYRELKEELGITDIKISLLLEGIIKHPLTPQNKKHFFHLFTGIYDGEINLNKSEVSEIKFVSLPELEKLLVSTPNDFTGGIHATCELYKKLSKNK